VFPQTVLGKPSELCADAFHLLRLAVRYGVFEKRVQTLQLLDGVISLCASGEHCLIRILIEVFRA
jgi:hypothetical protein